MSLFGKEGRFLFLIITPEIVWLGLRWAAANFPQMLKDMLIFISNQIQLDKVKDVEVEEVKEEDMTMYQKVSNIPSDQQLIWCRVRPTSIKTDVFG